MKLIDFKTPEFLYSSIIIDEDLGRSFVYCVNALSLLEFVDLEFIEGKTFLSSFDESRLAKEFTMKFNVSVEGIEEVMQISGNYKVYWIQNNCEFTGQDEQEILTKAIEFFEDRLVNNTNNFLNDIR